MTYLSEIRATNAKKNDQAYQRRRLNRPVRTDTLRGIAALVDRTVSPTYSDCAHAYGYYDRNNQWHANAVARADARGYYDRNGAWVNGAPNGYYDASGNWFTARTDPSAFRTGPVSVRMGSAPMRRPKNTSETNGRLLASVALK